MYADLAPQCPSFISKAIAYMLELDLTAARHLTPPWLLCCSRSELSPQEAIVAAACHLAALRSHQAGTQSDTPHSFLPNGHSHHASYPGPSPPDNHQSDDQHPGTTDDETSAAASSARQSEAAARRFLGHAFAHLRASASIPEAALAHTLQACVELHGSRKGRESRAEEHLHRALSCWPGQPKPAGLLLLLGGLHSDMSLTAAAVHLEPWHTSAWSTLHQVAADAAQPSGEPS